MKKPITRFMDMHSGGHQKTPYTHIYIEGSLDEAIKTFKNIFERDPDNVTCTCCGEDFTYEEYNSLEEATEYDRGGKWMPNSKGNYEQIEANITIKEYFAKNNDIILIKN